MAALARETVDRINEALDDDLNTAQAQAAVFEMVRKVNAAADAGEMKKDDVAPMLGALQKFDDIFAVLEDQDETKVRQIVEWAKAENKLENASEKVVDLVNTAQLSDAEIEADIAKMKQSRQARKFAESDAIRAQLAAAGIIVEITKDGIRWKRK
jgi:cysteinyl-tRNA synthetase